MYFTGRGFPEPFAVVANKSAEFNQRILEAIGKCQPGTTIVIDEIAARSKRTEVNTKLTTLAFNLY
jgi:O6-methylguanine-DNA--protein-cysteine methyltransferase